MPIIHLTISSSVFKFGIVGIINTLTSLSIIYFCKWGLDFGDVPSNFLGYAVGICISFFLNSKWTFRYKNIELVSAIKFGIVILIAYLLNLSTVIGLIHLVHLDGNFAQPVGIIPYTAFSYVACRFWVFSAQ